MFTQSDLACAILCVSPRAPLCVHVNVCDKSSLYVILPLWLLLKRASSSMAPRSSRCLKWHWQQLLPHFEMQSSPVLLFLSAYNIHNNHVITRNESFNGTIKHNSDQSQFSSLAPHCFLYHFALCVCCSLTTPAFAICKKNITKNNPFSLLQRMCLLVRR